MDCQRGDLIRPTAAPANADMTPGRDHSVTGGAIIPELGGAFARNQHMLTLEEADRLALAEQVDAGKLSGAQADLQGYALV